MDRDLLLETTVRLNTIFELPKRTKSHSSFIFNYLLTWFYRNEEERNEATERTN